MKDEILNTFFESEFFDSLVSKLISLFHNPHIYCYIVIAIACISLFSFFAVVVLVTKSLSKSVDSSDNSTVSRKDYEHKHDNVFVHKGKQDESLCNNHNGISNTFDISPYTSMSDQQIKQLIIHSLSKKSTSSIFLRIVFIYFIAMFVLQGVVALESMGNSLLAKLVVGLLVGYLIYYLIKKVFRKKNLKTEQKPVLSEDQIKTLIIDRFLNPGLKRVFQQNTYFSLPATIDCRNVIPNYDSISIENEILTWKNGYRVRFSDCITYKKEEKFVNGGIASVNIATFEGTIFAFEGLLSSGGDFRIIPTSTNIFGSEVNKDYKKLGSEEHKVETEHIAFNEMFDTYAVNPSDLFYYLSPVRIEKLLNSAKAGNKFAIANSNGVLYIAVPGKLYNQNVLSFINDKEYINSLSSQYFYEKNFSLNSKLKAIMDFFL